MSEPIFDYDLPPELIAQDALEERDAARLLCLCRRSGNIAHRRFRDLPDLLRAGDLLVLNDTRVLPARLLGSREKTGGQWEGLFLRLTPDGLWEMIAQTRGFPKPGEAFAVDPGPLRLVLERRTPDRHWLMRPDPPGDVETLLRTHGRIPLPPYIRKGKAAPEDAERYQTVYARRAGAVAAPTAGLHFTPALLERLADLGVRKTFVTLHVGLGTFRPVQTEDYTRHSMHEEEYEVTAETVAAITRTQADGGRVIAVGTTVVRALESAARSGTLAPTRGTTDLYIYPPYDFRVIDGLITNFHLPRSTLLLLVSAFSGIEALRRAYEQAIAERYRFYSYGDAMFIS